MKEEASGKVKAPILHTYIPALANAISQSYDETTRIFRDLIGHAMFLLRNDQGISQKQLADAAGIHYSTISSIESSGTHHGLDALKATVYAITRDVPDETSLEKRIVEVFERTKDFSRFL